VIQSFRHFLAGQSGAIVTVIKVCKPPFRSAGSFPRRPGTPLTDLELTQPGGTKSVSLQPGKL